MPSKLIERGFKFHCLADHGYMWDFFPTSNQAGPDTVPAIGGLSVTGSVVYHLLDTLLHIHSCVVYLDNFYASLPLLAKLRQTLKIGVCGTVRLSSAGFSVDLKIPKKDISKYDYHSVQSRVLTAFWVEVGVLLWFYNAPVTMMTTVHDLDTEVEKL